MLKPVPCFVVTNDTYIHINHGKKSLVQIDTSTIGVVGVAWCRWLSPSQAFYIIIITGGIFGSLSFL